MHLKIPSAKRQPFCPGEMNWLTWLLTWIFLCYPGLSLVDLICFGGYRFHVRYRPSDSSLVQVDRQHQAWLVVEMIAKSFSKSNLKIQGKVRGKILILESKLLWSISDHQTMKIFSKYIWWYNGMEPIAYLSYMGGSSDKTSNEDIWYFIIIICH